jgi:hypothetical protein
LLYPLACHRQAKVNPLPDCGSGIHPDATDDAAIINKQENDLAIPPSLI